MAIKFRTWDEPTDEFGNGGMSYFDGYLPKNDATAVMQFTGLKDKNGVEIYEGDIVHVSNSSVTRPVTRHKGGMWVLGGIALISGICKPCEVIGNIHNDPNLLHVPNNPENKD